MEMEKYQIAYAELKKYIVNFLKSGQKEHSNNDIEYRKLWDNLQNTISELTNNRVTEVDISGMLIRSLAAELSKNEIITGAQKDKILDAYKDTPDYTITNDDFSYQNIHLLKSYNFALDDDICNFYFLHCKNESGVKVSMISACLKKRDFARVEFLKQLLLKTSKHDDFELDVKHYGSWALELTRVIDELVKEFDKADSHNLSRDTITDEQIDNIVKLITDIISCLPQKMQDTARRKLAILIPRQQNDEEVVASALESVHTYVTNYKSRVRGAKEKTFESKKSLRDSIVILSHLHRIDVLSTIFSQLASIEDKLTGIDSYSWWMFHLCRNITGAELYSLFKMNREIFEVWIKGVDRVYDIESVAHQIEREVSKAQFLNFKKFIIEYKGHNVSFD